MLEQRVKIGEGGRVVIPASYRKALGALPGDELILRLEDGELRLFQQKNAVKKIQAAMKHKGKKQDHVEAFLKFRREDHRF